MDSLTQRLYDEIKKVRLIDPHSHINPHAPVSKSLNDLLGYHYYTELAHSAGLDKSKIEGPTGVEQAANIVGHLSHVSNTVQYQWMVELCQTFFGFADNELTPKNLPALHAQAGKTLAQPGWEDEVFAKTNLEAIFLTNDFDDPLEGFDTRRYIPCLRTDDLVFKLGQTSVQERFRKATGHEPDGWGLILKGIGVLFDRFVKKGARACAISLPPDFAPERPGNIETHEALASLLAGSASIYETRTVSYALFYALADHCAQHRLPFDLMIGVHRSVYPAGVYQGMDLYDKTTSLFQYRHLFNDFPQVVFPISVLTHNANQELVSYAWIFPNVVTNGHWWYSNIPTYIEADLRGRLEAVPRNKQIGYYSDAYKLEFVLPKFDMYRQCLARVLAADFVQARRWTEEKAIDLAHTILRGNVETIFPQRA